MTSGFRWDPRTSLLPALRRLRSRPWSSLAMILMLSLGIGTSAAMFSLLSEVLLHPLGLHHPERILRIGRQVEFRSGNGHVFISPELFAPPHKALERLHEEDPTLAAVCDIQLKNCTLQVEDRELRRITASFVPSEYFRVMDIHPAQGRFFSEAEAQAGEPVAILSHGLWNLYFNKSSAAIGTFLHVNGHPFRIVGIAPPGFQGHKEGFEGSELWCPARASDFAGGARMVDAFEALVRLKPGVSLSQARAALAVVEARHPSRTAMDARTILHPMELQALDLNRSKLLEARLPSPWLMLAASGLLLLLACANAGNLRLADLESRRQEFATRMALGASRWNLICQTLAEHLILTLASGILGLLIAPLVMALLGQIRDLKVYELPVEPSLNGPALLFAGGLVLVCTLLIGLPSALQMLRSNLAATLQSGSSRLTPTAGFQNLLLVFQVALALTLVSSGLMVFRGLNQARKLHLGFNPKHLALVRLELPPELVAPKHQDAKRSLLQKLQERVMTLPGVEAACLAGNLPLEPTERSQTTTIGVSERFIGPGYFRVLGIPLLEGAEFNETDLGNGTQAQIISRTRSQELWPDQNPIGRMEDNSLVLGVAEDHLESPEQGFHTGISFRMIGSRPFGSNLCLLVRCSTRPETLFPALRKAVAEVDASMPIVRLVSMENQLDGLHRHLSVAASLLGFCAFTALGLALFGIQSLMAFRISRQRRELALRMALGAQRRSILLQVLGQGMRRVFFGLGLGLLGAWLLGSLLPRHLQGIGAPDPWTLGESILLMTLAAILACLFPALRAASVDPGQALKEE